MAWSPYGKEGGAGNTVLDEFPFRMGVPLSKLSELQKWEGPDPAYWVQFGYAVVAPDARGVYNSEGNIYQFGTQEAEDVRLPVVHVLFCFLIARRVSFR